MKRSILALVPAVAAIAAAGCGTTGATHYANNPSTPAASATPATSAASSTVAVSSAKLGRILVDSHGRTLCLFEKDTGTSSTCLAACAAVWPPLTVTGAPRAGDGSVANKLGTTKRADGKTEVTYNGHPLYYYVADTAPGQTLGQGSTSSAPAGTCSPRAATRSRAAADESAGGATRAPPVLPQA